VQFHSRSPVFATRYFFGGVRTLIAPSKVGKEDQAHILGEWGFMLFPHSLQHALHAEACCKHLLEAWIRSLGCVRVSASADAAKPWGFCRLPVYCS
jgi:hypothetical protein